MEMVDEKVNSAYSESQEEQFIKISFSGTGSDGSEPAKVIHVHASNINLFHKIQVAVHLWENIFEYLKENDDSVTDMISNCLKARYKELMEKKEEKYEKNN